MKNQQGERSGRFACLLVAGEKYLPPRNKWCRKETIQASLWEKFGLVLKPSFEGANLLTRFRETAGKQP